MKTLGEFYRENVLSQKNLVLKELLYNTGNIEIDSDLFGWRLHSGKETFECRSEEEARYLKVFFDAGMSEVYVPKDDEYLKKILPELERIKTKIDDILNSYLETVLDRNARERLKHEVYLEITQ